MDLKFDINAIRNAIRSIPDFPKPGIMFRDITTLLKEPDLLAATIEQLTAPWRNQGITQVVGIESRGFILGVPMALALNTGFVPIRKPGKLPADTLSVEYDLEYGSDRIEIHKDALKAGERVLLVDDLLATGGTMQAALQLMEQMQAEVAACVFLVELTFLNGRDKLPSVPVQSLIDYHDET